MKYRILISFLLAFITSCSYLPDSREIETNLKMDQADYALYYSGTEVPENVFLMIPGGLVDPFVYACWINQLVGMDSTIAVVLVKYPSNLAIMNTCKVMKVIDKLENVSRWVIGGHSLGGTVAATVLNENREVFDGMILMGSWSRKATDLSDWDGTVLSIYGSEDEIASKEEILDNSGFLPEGKPVVPMEGLILLPGLTYYYEIVGGNHSGFGCYGPQDGDGEALISSVEQQELMLALITTYLDEIW